MGVDWMVNHEVNSTPRGGIVMDAMGMGKVGNDTSLFLSILIVLDHPNDLDNGVELVR